MTHRMRRVARGDRSWPMPLAVISQWVARRTWPRSKPHRESGYADPGDDPTTADWTRPWLPPQCDGPPPGRAINQWPRSRDALLRRVAEAAGVPEAPAVVSQAARVEGPAAAWFAYCHLFDHPDGRRATRGYIVEAAHICLEVERIRATAPTVTAKPVYDALLAHDLLLARRLLAGLRAVVTFRAELQRDDEGDGAPLLSRARTFRVAAAEFLSGEWAEHLVEIPALREAHLAWRRADRRYRTSKQRIEARLRECGTLHAAAGARSAPAHRDARRAFDTLGARWWRLVDALEHGHVDPGSARRGFPEVHRVANAVDALLDVTRNATQSRSGQPREPEEGQS
ncbi:MAG: hypothetical protein OXH69_10610 [Acidobacteria bacterium]|nr:hypothetical protein [Acidobacteriota bacterium]